MRFPICGKASRNLVTGFVFRHQTIKGVGFLFERLSVFKFVEANRYLHSVHSFIRFLETYCLWKKYKIKTIIYNSFDRLQYFLLRGK